MRRMGMNYMVTYRVPGPYRFTCKVRDNDNLQNSASTTVMVRNGKMNHLKIDNTDQYFPIITLYVTNIQVVRVHIHKVFVLINFHQFIGEWAHMDILQ